MGQWLTKPNSEPSPLIEVCIKKLTWPLSESTLQAYTLAKDLLTQCKQSALLQDLDEAISLFREALLQRPDPHIMRMYALNNLAIGLATRFDYLGLQEDLHQAISLIRESGVVRSNVLGDAGDSAHANVRLCLLHFYGGKH